MSGCFFGEGEAGRRCVSTAAEELAATSQFRARWTQLGVAGLLPPGLLDREEGVDDCGMFQPMYIISSGIAKQ